MKNNDIFKNYRIEEKFSYGKYFIDFLIVELKLIIEIDGEQHFRTEEAINHDKIRDEFFINEGFKVYRIKWLDVYKNANKEIEELISFIKNIDEESISRYNIELIINHVCKCGTKIKTKNVICISCRNPNNRKIKNRPSIDILIKEVENLGYCGVGRKYGVSDNAIRKWIKNSSIV